MQEIYKKRIKQLIKEFKKQGTAGAIHMNSWVYGRPDSVKALANPCGTAACIAGKAGLMPAFRKKGFRWNFLTRRFSNPPEVFFGNEVYCAVFIGTWCSKHIHTPAQAVLVLEDFLENGRLDCEWVPTPSVAEQVEALNPDYKIFEVSSIALSRNAGSYKEGDYSQLKRKQARFKKSKPTLDQPDS